MYGNVTALIDRGEEASVDASINYDKNTERMRFKYKEHTKKALQMIMSTYLYILFVAQRPVYFHFAYHTNYSLPHFFAKINYANVCQINRWSNKKFYSPYTDNS